MRKSNRNHGITLIALIITIIVMLILVIVTISMAVNGGLFGYARNATVDTELAKNKESELANLSSGMSIDDLIEKYTTGEIEEVHNWTREGDTFTCSHCDLEVEMGQIVEYTPNTENTTSIVSEIDSGIGRTQEMQRVNSTWVILGIEDQNNNGTDETLLITTATPIGDLLLFYGAKAYINGPRIMNKVCKDLYSNSTYGNARSMKIEDMNRAVNWTDTRGFYYDENGLHKANAGTKFSDLSPELKNSVIANGTSTPDGTSLDDYTIDGYFYYIDGNNVADDTGTSVPITERERNIIFGNGNYGNWLASRGFTVYDDFVSFGPSDMIVGIVHSNIQCFNSTGYEANDGSVLRPVVPLVSEIPTITQDIYIH